MPHPPDSEGCAGLLCIHVKPPVLFDTMTGRIIRNSEYEFDQNFDQNDSETYQNTIKSLDFLERKSLSKRSNCILFRTISTCFYIWAPWHSRGQRFDPAYLHQLLRPEIL